MEGKEAVRVTPIIGAFGKQGEGGSLSTHSFDQGTGLGEHGSLYFILYLLP